MRSISPLSPRPLVPELPQLSPAWVGQEDHCLSTANPATQDKAEIRKEFSTFPGPRQHHLHHSPISDLSPPNHGITGAGRAP